MTAKINIPTFDANVIFVFDISISSLKRYISKQFNIEIDNLSNDFAGITLDLENLSWLIYIPDTK